MFAWLLLRNRRFQDPGGERRPIEVSTGQRLHKPPAVSLEASGLQMDPWR